MAPSEVYQENGLALSAKAGHIIGPIMPPNDAKRRRFPPRRHIPLHTMPVNMPEFALDQHTPEPLYR
jgi:hypothetical protein